MTYYGVVSNMNELRRYGQVIAADGRIFPFLYDDCEGSPDEIKWQPIQFDVVPHPWQPDRQVAKRVRPAGALPEHTGRVALLRGTYGFISIKNAERVFFFRQLAPRLKEGDAVTCTAVPGKAHHLFALTVARTEEGVGTPLGGTPRAGDAQHKGQATPVRTGKLTLPMSPTVAAATRFGNRHGKDVNEDAFLVLPILGGEAWLLVVADGISRPENGWWASDKCMELIWRSLPDVEQQLLQKKGGEQQAVSEWLDRLHRDFLRERRSQMNDEFKQSSSTLTMAIVRGHDVFWAHCGDSRLYVLDPEESRLKGAFSENLNTQRSSNRYSGRGLSSHIAANGTDWNPLSDHLTIPEDGLLLLCSDGVVSRDSELKIAKSTVLKGLLTPAGSLQSAVSEALDRIRAAGETDDLTLVAFKPVG
ncbi:MAG: protein phosphatase 2C domain-containing protein [Verrucomicrobia bacterium]|nr:protein phosphatase 2C domain-containing protein [Verrucomicrobiota bacterium]